MKLRGKWYWARPSGIAPNRCFVIFHTGRCGSTVLTQLLNRQKGVFCAGEVFEWDFKNYQKNGGELSPAEFLTMRKQKRNPNAYFGCEIKILPGTHLDLMGLTPEQSVEAFSRLGFEKLILLHRANVLDRIISQLVAVHRKAYTRKPQEKVDIPSFRIPVNDIRVGPNGYTLVDAIQMFQDCRAAMLDGFASHDCEVLNLSFEADIRDDPNAAASKVARHVGFGFRPRKPALRRIVEVRKEDFIVNYDEVRRCLSDTAFEWMLQ